MPILCDSGFKKEKCKKLTNAERMKIYRANLKSGSPTKYREYCSKNCERVKRFNDNMSDDQKERQKILARERQRNRRARLKAHNFQITVPLAVLVKKMKTRAELTKQRKYWREKKRIQRESMSSQKRRRIKEYDRAYRKALRSPEEKSTEKKINPSTAAIIPSQTENSNNAAAIRQAVCRAKLPKKATMFAQVVKKVINTATPRKKEALNLAGVVTSPIKKAKKRLNFFSLVVSNVKNRLNALKGTSNNSILEKRVLTSCVGQQLIKKYRLGRTAAETFGVKRTYLTKCSQLVGNVLTEPVQKKRSDTLLPSTIKKIQSFYHRSDISRELPTRKSYNAKTQQAKKVLEMTLNRAYQMYLVAHPKHKVSFSKFSKLRPKSIKTVDNTNLEQYVNFVKTWS